MIKTTKPRRVSVAEAKAKLSETLRRVEEGPTIIHNRGRDVAVLLGVAAYSELVGNETIESPAPMRAFLNDIEALKGQLGGGAELHAGKLAFVPREPFARARR